jgi:hypothetical protein
MHFQGTDQIIQQEKARRNGKKRAQDAALQTFFVSLR